MKYPKFDYYELIKFPHLWSPCELKLKAVESQMSVLSSFLHCSVSARGILLSGWSQGSFSAAAASAAAAWAVGIDC